MPPDQHSPLILPRRGSREREAAPVAIMVGSEADMRRLRSLAPQVAGSRRRAYNATLMEIRSPEGAITVAGPMLGAPQAVLLLEKLVVCGSHTFFVLGWCGSLQAPVRIGDLVLAESAVSEEGTSPLYPDAQGDLGPTPELRNSLLQLGAKAGIRLHQGGVWSTDAPLQETAAKVSQYAGAGLLGVDMETSALFKVAVLRGVKLAVLLVVADELFRGRWRPGAGSKAFKNGCQVAARLIFAAAVEAVATAKT